MFTETSRIVVVCSGQAGARIESLELVQGTHRTQNTAQNAIQRMQPDALSSTTRATSSFLEIIAEPGIDNRTGLELVGYLQGSSGAL